MKDMFYFGHEKSLSSLYSAGLFLVLSVYFRQVKDVVASDKKYWQWLGYLAIFLACDEWFAIHDSALNIYGMGRLNIPIWVWVYGGLLLGLVCLLMPFLCRMPRYLMGSLILSGIVYVSGSALMEVVTYSYNNSQSVLQQMGWFFEDSLEMVGVLVAIELVSTWLKRHQVTGISFQGRTVCIVMVDLLVSYILAIR
ncbi:MAG: hypothetical protein ACO3K7_02715 [Candidatus Marinamargulisbacteria bacterium]